jgi:sortase A
MDNKSGGQVSDSSASQKPQAQTSAEKQRKTAVDLARQKVLNAYKTQPQNYKPEESAQQYNSGMPQVNQDEWKKYHTAWQNYYQQYYGNYYNKAAAEYINKEKERIEREQAESLKKKTEKEHQKLRNARLGFAAEKSQFVAASAEQISETEALQNGLRARIRKKVKSRAKKMSKSRHFWPIMVGLVVLMVGLLFEYNQTIASHFMAYVAPGGGKETAIQTIDFTVTANVHESPTLMIPKLNIEVPVTFGAQNDVRSMQGAMSNGVANFYTSASSAMPGQIGNFAVSGHSAGNIYDYNNQYKFIFSGLTRLQPGDMIYMDYEGQRYSYRVQGSSTVEPTDVGELARISADNPGKPMITLITCTPLGTSRYRLLVYGEQIYPDYEKAEEAATIESSGDETMDSTQNSPRPSKGFWNWLTGNND